MNKLLPIAIAAILVTGVSSAYAFDYPIPGKSWESFCDKKAFNNKITAADYLCAIGIFQMKEDIQSNQDRITAIEGMLELQSEMGADDISLSTMENMYSTIYFSSIETNPPGDDSHGEYVVVCNDSDTILEITGWQIIPTSNPDNAYVFPEIFDLMSCVNVNFYNDSLDNNFEQFELRKNTGELVIDTIPLVDYRDDNSAWQYDKHNAVWTWVILEN